MIRYGSRKFLLALASLVVFTALLWVGKIDQAVFRDLMQWTVAAYIAGNVLQKATSKA